jgi:hypothetical protein
MISGLIQCCFVRINTLNQKTTLVVHIRDVVNRFVPAGSVNREKSTEMLSEFGKLLSIEDSIKSTGKIYP